MTEDNKAAIKALVKAQSSMTRALKDTDNPFFKSKYADLTSVQDACFPALHENGFVVMHRVAQDDAGSYVQTLLLHENGAEWSCNVPLVVAKNDMQGLGSAITYARRYGLMCLSGVAPEDDDGNQAAKNPPKAAPTPSPDEIDAELRKISTIDSLDELKAYWSALVKTRPEMAKVSSIALAKDDRKNALTEAAE